MPTKKTVTVKHAAARASGTKIAVENVNVPGYTHRVDAEMWQGLAAYVPRKLFPDSGKIGWWMKTVQLDLEAKGLVKREDAEPLRWHKGK